MATEVLADDKALREGRRQRALDQMGATLEELLYWRLTFESWQHYYCYDYEADSNLVGLFASMWW